MTRQSHSYPEPRRLATDADVHRAFDHLSEIKVLAILALRPTTEEVDEAARRLN
jgi:hypothetical protein